jgi:hypothetical protein
MEVPIITTTTLATAVAGAWTYNYDMRGANIASLQLHSTFSNAGDTDVITLKISNDGVNFVPFATNKTVTLTGGTTDDALFELGVIDYVWLQVSGAAPSAHTITVVGTLYATATIVRD